MFEQLLSNFLYSYVQYYRTRKNALNSFTLKLNKKYAAALFESFPEFAALCCKSENHECFRNLISRFLENGHLFLSYFKKVGPISFLGSLRFI